MNSLKTKTASENRSGFYSNTNFTRLLDNQYSFTKHNACNTGLPKHANSNRQRNCKTLFTHYQQRERQPL